MLVQNPKEIADKLETISKDVVRSGAMPIITKNGILIGTFLIQPKEGRYNVKQGSQIIYSTYSKSAAMIIARMLIKRMNNIESVIEADRIAFSARQDLEIFKQNIDDLREELIDYCYSFYLEYTDICNMNAVNYDLFIKHVIKQVNKHLMSV